MPYFVKWYIAGQDEAQEQQTAYATPDHAMDFACAILRQDPTDIWVEDDAGNQIALDARIRRHCGARGLA